MYLLTTRHESLDIATRRLIIPIVRQGVTGHRDLAGFTYRVIRTFPRLSHDFAPPMYVRPRCNSGHEYDYGRSELQWFVWHGI